MTGAVGQALSVPSSNGKGTGGKGAVTGGEAEAAFSEAIRDASARRDDQGQKQQASAESEPVADEGPELQVPQQKRDGTSGENRLMQFFLHLSSETARRVLDNGGAGVRDGENDTFSLAAKRVADVIGRKIDEAGDAAAGADADSAGGLTRDAAPDGGEMAADGIIVAQPSAQVAQAAARSAEKAAMTAPGVFTHARAAALQGDGGATGKQSLETGQTGGGEGDDLFRFARASGSPDEGLAPEKLTGDRLRDVLDPAVRRPHGGTEDAAFVKQAAAERQQGLEAPVIDKQALAGIDIVETRKYLGVATGQTAVASVMSAVTENAEFNTMLRDVAATAATTLNAAKNASNSLKIQLSPPELGTVNATFRMSGGHLTIELMVETIEAYRQLSDENSGLLKAMRGQGYDIEQVVVHHVTGDRVTATAQAGTTQQAGGQPGQPGGQMAGGSGGSSGQQAQSGQNGNPQQNAGGQGEGERRSHQQHNRSGDIYL